MPCGSVFRLQPALPCSAFPSPWPSATGWRAVRRGGNGWSKCWSTCRWCCRRSSSVTCCWYVSAPAALSGRCSWPGSASRSCSPGGQRPWPPSWSVSRSWSERCAWPFRESTRGLRLAARSLGAGPLRSFLTVSLPLARRGLIAGCVLGFARSLGEFGATIMVAGNIEGQTRTIPLAIYTLTNQPGGMDRSWRLVGLAIVLACGALAVSEWLERRRPADASA